MRRMGPPPPPNCPERPGAYAVVVDESWRVAVVLIEGEPHLPGGGLEEGEDHEQALHRELAEETGLVVEVRFALGPCHEVVTTPSGRTFDKAGQYYICRVVSAGEATEPGHVLEWWRSSRAMAELTEETERHMVRRALKSC